MSGFHWLGLLKVYEERELENIELFTRFTRKEKIVVFHDVDFADD